MTLKYGYLVNVNIKTLIFQASWYKNKIIFRVNPKSTLFQRWILSMKQRWQINVESTWISRWPTSRCYFDMYQCWINVECLLGLIPEKENKGKEFSLLKIGNVLHYLILFFTEQNSILLSVSSTVKVLNVANCHITILA